MLPPLLFLLPALVLGGQFVDICRSDSGHRCCAPSMAGSEYWVMRAPGAWTELEVECRIEQFLDTGLVVLDDRAEMYCLMKYILDHYPSEASAQYAIGLQSPDDYPGVYEWRSGGQVTPTFTAWASGSPADHRCVSMRLGAGQSGQWTDGDCVTDKTLYGICERKLNGSRAGFGV